jgi:hypothetical protein
MGNHAENTRGKDVRTGPQGTRVFKREEIDRYFAERDMESNISSGAPSGASLVGISGRFRNRRFDIPTGRSTVGRSSTNNIVIDADSVSLVHARILQKDDEWWVLNLLSTNGTYVNDKKVTDSRIHDGDRIHFGDTEFIFHNPEPEKTMGLGLLFSLGRKLRALFGGRNQ